MPYTSDAQRRFAHTATGKQFGPETVAEFDAATKGKELPERAGKKKAKKDAIGPTNYAGLVSTARNYAK